MGMVMNFYLLRSIDICIYDILWSSISLLWSVLPPSSLPSGKLTVCYWTWPLLNSGFFHYKWWFSILMLVYQRVNTVHCSFGSRGWAGRGLRVCERCLRDESLGPAAEGAERALFFCGAWSPKEAENSRNTAGFDQKNGDVICIWWMVIYGHIWSYLVGGFKWLLFSISYRMSSQPHWRTHIF